MRTEYRIDSFQKTYFVVRSLDELAELMTRDLSALVDDLRVRSEEHTSELQSLMRISYAVFCLKKNKNSMFVLTVLFLTTLYSHNTFSDWSPLMCRLDTCNLTICSYRTP